MSNQTYSECYLFVALSAYASYGCFVLWKWRVIFSNFLLSMNSQRYEIDCDLARNVIRFFIDIKVQAQVWNGNECYNLRFNDTSTITEHRAMFRKKTGVKNYTPWLKNHRCVEYCFGTGRYEFLSNRYNFYVDHRLLEWLKKARFSRENILCNVGQC